VRDRSSAASVVWRFYIQGILTNTGQHIPQINLINVDIVINVSATHQIARYMKNDLTEGINLACGACSAISGLDLHQIMRHIDVDIVTNASAIHHFARYMNEYIRVRSLTSAGTAIAALSVHPIVRVMNCYTKEVQINTSSQSSRFGLTTP